MRGCLRCKTYIVQADQPEKHNQQAAAEHAQGVHSSFSHGQAPPQLCHHCQEWHRPRWHHLQALPCAGMPHSSLVNLSHTCLSQRNVDGRSLRFCRGTPTRPALVQGQGGTLKAAQLAELQLHANFRWSTVGGRSRADLNCEEFLPSDSQRVELKLSSVGLQGFGEIAFCAVTAMEQVKGFGTRLMNHTKVQSGPIHS